MTFSNNNKILVISFKKSIYIHYIEEKKTQFIDVVETKLNKKLKLSITDDSSLIAVCASRTRFEND
jgi:hypothetical protein